MFRDSRSHLLLCKVCFGRIVSLGVKRGKLAGDSQKEFFIKQSMTICVYVCHAEDMKLF